jgi:hypothetical protein
MVAVDGSCGVMMDEESLDDGELKKKRWRECGCGKKKKKTREPKIMENSVPASA